MIEPTGMTVHSLTGAKTMSYFRKCMLEIKEVVHS
jgi:hypothetical protein